MAAITPFDPLALRRSRVVGAVAERAVDLSVRDLVYGPHDWLTDHVVDLAALVGGFDVLERLDDKPLPDEPFDWNLAGLAHRALVIEVLGRSDAWCDELFDVEVRTVARRLLARAVRAGAPPLRDDAELARLAAGLVWLAAKGNGRLGKAAGLYAKHLWAHCGVRDSGAIGRAIAVAVAVAVNRQVRWRDHYWIDSRVEWLGDVELLTGAMRSAILRRLDELLDATAGDAAERIALFPFGRVSGGGWERIRALRYGVRRVVKAADGARRAYVVIELGEASASRLVALRLDDAFALRAGLDDALALPASDDLRWPS